MRRLPLLALMVLMMVLGACSTNKPADGGTETGPQIGQMAPDFTLLDEEGRTVTLSEFRGAPVLLNFWATWCGPCKAEMPEFQHAADSLEGKLVVIAVDAAETKGQVKAFKDELGLSLLTPIDSRNKTAQAYNIFGLPATYVIDKDGVIRAVKFGPFVGQEELQAKLATVLPKG